MALFRRPGRAADPTATAVTAFWQWWQGAHAGLAADLEAGHGEALADVLGPRVAAVHPDLDWETSPGLVARHALVVSSAGNPALRTVAERWFRSAPPADDVWEFGPARRPDGGLTTSSLTVAGRTIELAATVVAARVDDQRCRVDVVVHHPAFPDLPDDARRQVALLVLDWALGEDDVERWVGRVETAALSPLDPVPVTGLGAVVHELRGRWGPQSWVLLEGTGPKGRRVVALARRPIHRVDHPLFDEHLVVRLPFTDQADDGQPGELALAQLRAFEEHLVARVGKAAVLVAHETSGGQRLLHLYGDRLHSVRPQLEPLVAAWTPKARVEAEPDPAWAATVHLRQ